jgi:hypothetical protein
LKNRYNQSVRAHLSRVKKVEKEILKKEDIAHLPGVVQKYLHYTKVVGKEKVISFRAEFKGGIRSKHGEPFMKLRSVQYNFTDRPARLFYIVARKKGIPAIGLHLYQDANATFQIRILGLFTVVDARGEKMDKGETVTVFNDMCVMAPVTLIDRNIEWEVLDDLSVSAKYKNGNITINATLQFNDRGELVNFISNDRYETDGKVYKNYPWETPISEYRDVRGYRLPSKAKLIYKYPDTDFCYGEFELVDIEYNCMKLR